MREPWRPPASRWSGRRPRIPSLFSTISNNNPTAADPEAADRKGAALISLPQTRVNTRFAPFIHTADRRVLTRRNIAAAARRTLHRLAATKPEGHGPVR